MPPPGDRIAADARLVEHGEHRIVEQVFLVGRQFAEALVGRPQRAGLLQRRTDFRRRVRGHPRLDEGAELGAGVPAAGVGLEVDALGGLDFPEGLGEAAGRRQGVDMAIGENADHDEAAVPGFEVAAEGAEDLVAEPRPVDLVDHRLADVAQRRGRGERHVLQREHDPLPLPGQPPVPFGRQDRHGAGIGGGEVPRRRHGVHRPVMVHRAGHQGKAGDGVHRVVDMGAAVARAHDIERDQIGALLGECLVGKPAARRHVGGEDAGALARRGDQRAQKLAAARRAQVDGDRALALVQASPIDRAAVLGDRPAVVVEPALDVVEADHVGAQLGERHPAQRGGDERRAFDDAKAGENACHRAFPVVFTS